jgi:hypothetical protein
MAELNCPICGKKLRGTVRVREERVPTTVPEYYSREKQAPYRRTISYEIVQCSEKHTFKRVDDNLYGMRVDIL